MKIALRPQRFEGQLEGHLSMECVCKDSLHWYALVRDIKSDKNMTTVNRTEAV